MTHESDRDFFTLTRLGRERARERESDRNRANMLFVRTCSISNGTIWSLFLISNVFSLFISSWFLDNLMGRWQSMKPMCVSHSLFDTNSQILTHSHTTNQSMRIDELVYFFVGITRNVKRTRRLFYTQWNGVEKLLPKKMMSTRNDRKWD